MNKEKNNKEKLSPGQAKISPRLFFHQRHKPKTLQDRNSEQCVPKIAISKLESMLYWSNESICCLVTKYYTITIIIMIITKIIIIITIIYSSNCRSESVCTYFVMMRACFTMMLFLFASAVFCGERGGHNLESQDWLVVPKISICIRTVFSWTQ